MSRPREKSEEKRTRRSKVIPQFAFDATTSSLPVTISNYQPTFPARNLVTLLCPADSPLGFQQHVYGIRPRIPEIEPDATVGKLRDGRGDGAGGQIPSGR